MLDKRREFVPERIDSWTILPSSVRREHVPVINGADCHHTDSHLYCHILALVIYLAERQTFLKAYGPTLYIGYFEHTLLLLLLFVFVLNSVSLAYVNK